MKKYLLLIPLLFLFPAGAEAAITQIKDDPISTGLVGYWSLEEASGTRDDATSTVNNLSETNTPVGAPAKQGDGADLEDGDNDFLSVTDGNSANLDLSTTGNITVAFWFKPETLPANEWLIGKDANGSRGWLLYYEPGEAAASPWKWRWSGDGTNAKEHNLGGTCTDMAIGTWIHVVLRYTDATHASNLNVNGSLSCSSSSAGTSGTFNSTGPFFLGALWADGGNQNGDGIFDEVAIWSRTLTDTEITDLYNGGTGVPYEGEAPPAEPTVSPFMRISGDVKVGGDVIMKTP
jgi:hypothetical protein